MEFRLLGPVEVRVGDREVALGALKQRHLLAALLFDGGHATTFETLVDRVWGEQPPADARGTLYGYVARLRRALSAVEAEQRAGVRLERWSGGYVLHLPAGTVDLYRFRQLVAAAHTADGPTRATLLAEANDLWRGEALAGLPGEWASRVREGLAQERISALVGWAAEAVELGSPDSVVTALFAALVEQPLSEPLVASVMGALHAAGRTPEALEWYARTRLRIVEELGVEPGKHLREVHATILRAPDEPAPEPVVQREARPAASRTFQLPPDLPDYLGYATQVAFATAALDPGVGRRVGPPVLVVSGQGGAGKTALAVHVAHAVRSAYPDGQLFLSVGGADPLEPAEALSRALRAVGVTDVPRGQDLNERIARYRAELAGRRMLVLIDDATSAHQVRPFLPGDTGCAVIVTSRRRLTTIPAVARIELDVMSTGEATSLIAQMIGAARVGTDPAEAVRLVNLCARLPLAIRVAGARLAARPHWTVAQLADRLSDERRRLDELRADDLEVRASLSVSYQGLGPDARHALRLLGFLDAPDFTAATAAALLDLDLPDAQDLIEQVTDARLLDVVLVDGARSRYRMHDLVRLYAKERAVQEDPAERLRAAVRRVVESALAVVEQLSEQLPLATAPIYQQIDRPTPAAQGSQADPRLWLDTEDAALIALVERAAALGLAELACALADSLVFASFAVHNGFDGWERTHSAALAAARSAGDVRSQAAMECGMGQLRYTQDRFAEARVHFAAAAELYRDAGDDHGEAVALNGLGTVARELSDHLVALPQIQQALRALDRLGDAPGVAHAHYSLGFAYRELGDDDAAVAHLTAARDLYDQLGHRRGRIVAVRGIGLVHRARGELERAERCCAEAHAEAVDLCDQHMIAYTTQALAKVWIRQGMPDRAGEPLAEALVTMTAMRDGQGTALVTRTIGEMHLAAGRLTEARETLTDAAARWQSIGMELGRARTLRDLGAAQYALGDHEAAHRTWVDSLDTVLRLGVREGTELDAWRRRWGCRCPADQLGASVSSAVRSTRSTLPPASLASSGSDQPRATSSANSTG